MAALAAALGALAVMTALIVPGCGGGQATVVTSTVVETVTAATTSTTSTGATGRTTRSTTPEAGNIREVDWKAVVGTQPFVRDVEEVIYSDLTGDGQEDALVLVRLEGSGAYLDYYVYTLTGGDAVMLFEKTGISRSQVRLGPLPLSFVETTAVYAPGDPNCCPSNLMHTTYQWYEADQAFTVTNTEVVPNPQPQPLS